MKASKPDDPFSRTLSDWKVAPRRDPQFRAGVWARLERGRRGAPSWSTFVRAHSALVAGFVAVALGAGAVTGRERARARVQEESAQLATSYVESLDARLMRMP